MHSLARRAYISATSKTHTKPTNQSAHIKTTRAKSIAQTNCTMPTYDYICDACQHEWELFQRITEDHIKKCPACKKNKAVRQFGTGAAVMFKGSGFYETDYRSDSYKKSAEADKKKTDSGSSDSSSKSDSGSKTGSGTSSKTKSDSSSSDSKKTPKKKD